MKPVLLLAFFCLSMTANSGTLKKIKRVLVFSKTAAFRHASIPEGIQAVLRLGKENGFAVDTTSDSTQFNLANLKRYAAIVFMNSSGNVFNTEQENAFQQYIRNGGGFVGVHGATITEYDWPWYGNLVGAYFGTHPSPTEVVLKVVDPASIATKHLPAEWKMKDEWYNFRWMTSEPLHVLIDIDETSYNPGEGKMGAAHPISWYHDFEGGRAFYTGLGDLKETYSNPLFLKHLLGGIQYAMGLKKMNP